MLIDLIIKTQIALLHTKKVTILIINLNFANVFSKKSSIVLLEQTNINNYIINLEINI